MKKLLSCMMVTILLFSIVGNALAADVDIQSSNTLSSYKGILSSGASSGKINLTFSVSARSTADSVGISKIKIYKSNGNYVTTIIGTKSNGLLITNDNRHSGTYTYSGTSKTSYYAVVTFTATINGVTDTKSFTTNTMKAP